MDRHLPEYFFFFLSRSSFLSVSFSVIFHGGTGGRNGFVVFDTEHVTFSDNGADFLCVAEDCTTSLSLSSHIRLYCLLYPVHSQ